MSGLLRSPAARRAAGLAIRAARSARARTQKPVEGTPGPPDFIGVGSVGGGGPWWHGLLTLHPDIQPARNRKAAQRFFDDYCFKILEDPDIREYHARFAKLPGKLTGEWTDVYAVQPWTLPLLKRVAPDAKILVMLVNPFEAYRKAYLQRKARVDRGDKRVWMNTAAADREYGTQIAALHRFFDPSNILVLQLERCRQDPVGEYQRSLRFLGARENFTPPQHRLTRSPKHERVYEALQKAHVPEGALDAAIGRPPSDQPSGAELWPDIEKALHTDLDEEMRLLAALRPEVDLSLWPEFAHLAAERSAA